MAACRAVHPSHFNRSRPQAWRRLLRRHPAASASKIHLRKDRWHFHGISFRRPFQSGPTESQAGRRAVDQLVKKVFCGRFWAICEPARFMRTECILIGAFGGPVEVMFLCALRRHLMKRAPRSSGEARKISTVKQATKRSWPSGDLWTLGKNSGSRSRPAQNPARQRRELLPLRRRQWRETAALLASATASCA